MIVYEVWFHFLCYQSGLDTITVKIYVCYVTGGTMESYREVMQKQYYHITLTSVSYFGTVKVFLEDTLCPFGELARMFRMGLFM